MHSSLLSILSELASVIKLHKVIIKVIDILFQVPTNQYRIGLTLSGIVHH